MFYPNDFLNKYPQAHFFSSLFLKNEKKTIHYEEQTLFGISLIIMALVECIVIFVKK